MFEDKFFGKFICPDGNLSTVSFSIIIKEQTWISAVYYGNFKQFFQSRSVAETFSLLRNHPDSPEAKRMLSAVQTHYWEHIFQPGMIHSQGDIPKFHEHNQALVLHSKRADYVLKLVLSTPWIQFPFLFCCRST